MPEPYATGHLEVSDGQRLYWETVGDPDGVPVLYLHGGPGSGSTAWARRYFGPGLRGILFDQRGCGRSRPLADTPDYDLTVNTTPHQLADIEALREHLGVTTWVVMGVSWGVTLGLAYAEQHPERVSAMVLGAVTAGTSREIGWITRDMGRLFPEEYDEFVGLLPEEARDGDVAGGYATLLASNDATVRARAARQWCRWEDTHVSLMPGWQPDPRYADPQFAAVFARLVTHYWSHGCFLADGQIIGRLSRIAEIPATLVHGRHDVSSPLDTAWRLHEGWPASRLVVVEDAGHGGGSFPDEMAAALRSTADLLM
jgi:proline iminopeptidase